MYFETAKTIEQAKNLFRDLCKKLHPDTSGFDSQSEFIKMFNEFKNFKPNDSTGEKSFDASKFYDLVKKFDVLQDIKINFVGTFIWLEDIKPNATYLQRNVIKNIILDGFNSVRFAPTKKLWYFSPVDYVQKSKSKKDFEEIGLNYDFVQDNQSKSKKGVLRGLHFQKENTQAKLVRCIKGEVFDVAVDLRPGSKTYGKWEGVILTEENKKMFMIPRGFAHGFLVLSDEAEFTYKCDDIYNHEAEGGLKFDDPDVGIEWPMGDLKKEDLITSEKDAKWPSLQELKQTDLFKNIKGEN